MATKPIDLAKSFAELEKLEAVINDAGRGFHKKVETMQAALAILHELRQHLQAKQKIQVETLDDNLQCKPFD